MEKFDFEFLKNNIIFEFSIFEFFENNFGKIENRENKY